MVLDRRQEFLNGIIKEILIPQEYDEFGELKEDFDVNNLWFKVQASDILIDVIVPRNKYYGNFFVGDEVKLIKNITLYTNDEYEVNLKKQLNIYCSYMTIEQRKEKYKELLDKNNYIVDYDIKGE